MTVLLVTPPILGASGPNYTAPVSLPLGSFELNLPTRLTLQAKFNCIGGGGTSLSAWAQTSFDNQVTWVDFACFGFFSASAILLFNLNAGSVTTTPIVATNGPGSLAVNTAIPGLAGQLICIQWSSVGNYGIPGAILEIDGVVG